MRLGLNSVRKRFYTYHGLSQLQIAEIGFKTMVQLVGRYAKIFQNKLVYYISNIHIFLLQFNYKREKSHNLELFQKI